LGHPAARRRRTGGPVGRPGPHPVPDLVSHEETRDMETTTALDARAWIDGFIAVIAARSAELTELDRQAGDGDYGTNLRSALRRTETNLNGVADDSPKAVFTAVSDAFLNTGGTSGPLFGMWFREFAKAAHGEPATATLAEGAATAVAAVQRLGHAEVGHKTLVRAVATAAEARAAAAPRAVAAVQRLGKAKVGHKTMVDAMARAAEALAAAAARGADLPEALRETAAAAHAGARSTEELLAQRGRASYVGEHARGVVDPGALTVALFFDAAVATVQP